MKKVRGVQKMHRLTAWWTEGPDRNWISTGLDYHWDIRTEGGSEGEM